MVLDPDAVTVGEIMRTDVRTLSVDLPVEDAIELFEDIGIGGAPVVDETGALRGVITETDLLAAERKDPAAEGESGGDIECDDESGEADDGAGTVSGATVGDWMTPALVTVTPDATLGEVCDLMERETIHRVLVTDGERLLGIVSASDVVRLVARSSSAWSGGEAARSWEASGQET